ncbi:hypothetical protein MG293_000177 [Ovis ammon polii]|uniref:Uncharacterized protein n=1 Tax=Ovis ammon polii TaxID=230172 RepID=A0AAD4UJV9_OVIAM|nr:hypothetical protein MG293_000177 [Ovis ammon polii]
MRRKPAVSAGPAALTDEEKKPLHPGNKMKTSIATFFEDQTHLGSNPGSATYQRKHWTSASRCLREKASYFKENTGDIQRTEDNRKQHSVTLTLFKSLKQGGAQPLFGDLPDPGIEPLSPALEGGFFTTEPPGKPHRRSALTQKLRSKKQPGSTSSSKRSKDTQGNIVKEAQCMSPEFS